MVRGSQPVAFVRTDNSGRPILLRHALTLIVRRCLLAFASDPAETGLVCACTHYLVFKEPTHRSAPGASSPRLPFGFARRVCLSYFALSSLSTLFLSLTFEIFLRSREALSASLRGTFQDYHRPTYSSTAFLLRIKLSFRSALAATDLRPANFQASGNAVGTNLAVFPEDSIQLAALASASSPLTSSGCLTPNVFKVWRTRIGPSTPVRDLF